MASKERTEIGIPAEIRDTKIGVVAKAAGRLSVGHANQTRAVIISFDDHGTVYSMSPATARQLAKELVGEADAMSQ